MAAFNNNINNMVGKYKVAVMVVMAGFISNMVVKGIMKSIGKNSFLSKAYIKIHSHAINLI